MGEMASETVRFYVRPGRECADWHFAEHSPAQAYGTELLPVFELGNPGTFLVCKQGLAPIQSLGSLAHTKDADVASVQSELLVEQKVANARKSTGIAYLLFFTLGSFGAHRFYLGRKDSAIAMLGLGLVGCMFWQLLILSLIWCTVDGFLIPRFMREHSAVLRQQARIEVAQLDQSTTS